MNAELILGTLERAAEKSDPAPLMYALLFKDHPEMEHLFWRDRDGSIRGHMFQEMVAALVDFLGPNSYGENLFRIEHTNHEQLGVPPDVYSSAFTSLRDALRQTLKDQWTEADEVAWRELLATIGMKLQASA